MCALLKYISAVPIRPDYADQCLFGHEESKHYQDNSENNLTETKRDVFKKFKNSVES
jgi:hypothetical protein